MTATTQPPSNDKRAGVACLACRGRKVRCDVQLRGIPCANCAHDSVQCYIRSNKRGRPAKARSVGGGKGPKQQAKDDSPANAERIVTDGLPSHRIGHAIHTAQWLPEAVADVSIDVPVQRAPFSTPIAVTNALQDENLHQELSYADLIGTSVRQALPSWTETVNDALPSFIKPISEALDPDNLDFLRKKGALQIPARELRDEIINCYLQYVHPQLPVLDESTLREIARDPSSMKTAPLSILLFQAAMFSAVHFIAVDSIRKAGFDRALDIRRAFYAKARLLYDFDVESDRLVIVQSLILMAYMSETPGDAKGGWHWIGAAYGLAMTLGLHRKVDYATLNPRESRLRRRIWWSCYIRDRTLALAMNRPWRIRDEDFDTPMLTLADFDLGVDDQVQHQHQSPPDNSDRQDATSLAQVTVSLAQLCTQISDILDIHFSTLPEEGASPLSHPPDGTGLTTTLYFAKSQIKQIDRVVACDRKLQSWFKNRPVDCIYSPNGSSSLVLNRAFVNLVYFSLVSALHRPLLRANVLGDFVEYQMLSERRVRDAALETCRMSAHLHELGLGQFYPGAAALLQVPAVIFFLRELRSPNNNNSARPCGEIFSSIQACIDVVEDVKERHIGAQIGLIIALGLLRRSNVAVQTDPRTGRVAKLLELTHSASNHSLDDLAKSQQPQQQQLQAASEPGNNLPNARTDDIGRGVTGASMDTSTASFWDTLQETGVDFALETRFFADQGFSESLVSDLVPFVAQDFTDHLYTHAPYPDMHKAHED